MLDKLTTIDIIDFTDRLRGSFAREKVSYHQTAGLAPTRHSPSTPGCGDRHAVSRQRIFRPARWRSGEIRDAPPRAGRFGVGESGRRCLRLLAAVVLPGAGRLCPTRIGGIIATQAWTAAGPQADDRRNGFHHHVADQRTQPDFRRAGAPDQGKVRRDRTSPQYRTPIGAPGKKTSLSAADTYDTSRTRNLAADYEPLRTQVLAGQHHGHGLSILV